MNTDLDVDMKADVDVDKDEDMDIGHGKAECPEADAGEKFSPASLLLSIVGPFIVFSYR